MRKEDCSLHPAAPEALSGKARDPLGECLTKKKPSSAYALLRALLFPSLSTASCCRSENNKALLLSQQGFFFVDNRFEISNLSLIKDMADLIKLAEVFLISPEHVK